jgi:Ca-activated chloride channel homolog
MGTGQVWAWLAAVEFLAPLWLPGQVSITPRLAIRAPRDTTLSTATLRIDSSLVLVPVSVFDIGNRPVTGLKQEHFRIFDDKVEQTVTQFAMEDEPLAVGLVFDTSRSMANKLSCSRAAALEFFQTANPEDEFFLVEFNDRPKLAVPMTQNFEEIEKHLAFAVSNGKTAPARHHSSSAP